ncbi:MAG TPA: class I SAM-dependent methyltransferase [Anaerolineales bacterium]|nr:class I SAM-dependent methyltransferase [Anaerolineales bacterium]
MDWHRRYTQQARWTRDLRAYLFDKAGLSGSRRVLEVGCGTGAILSELPKSVPVHGLDIDPAALAQCRLHAPASALVRGDALQLPYSNQSFDIVYCHFLLLWVSDPQQAVLEMKRVSRTGGYVMAFAEPDYDARLDEPSELIPLGRWQAESLRRQGADPGLGARLAALFFSAGIELLETGPIQRTSAVRAPVDFDLEWAVIESDLSGVIAHDEIQKMKRLDEQARALGERVLHVPTYFAWGRA